MTVPGKGPRISLALISEGVATTWPVYVARERGLFERAGLNVEVTLTRSSVRQLEALKAGTYDIGFQQADHVVRAVEQDSDLFIFMPTARAAELTLVAAPDVRSLVAKLRFPRYAGLRNYDRINVFIEALHHLYTTGKPLFAYP